LTKESGAEAIEQAAEGKAAALELNKNDPAGVEKAELPALID
jgi:hypothetical protein